jgi:succinate dehydrogenase / fumarate reductase cytochrome b subunit
MSTKRPLSPHLTIYKPQITSVLSIAHRLSGIFLYIGCLLFAWTLIFSTYESSFATSFLNITSIFFTSIIGQALLFFWSFALFYHLCNGIRHMFWDMGKGFELRTVTISGIAVLVVSLSSTLASWCIAIKHIF